MPVDKSLDQNGSVLWTKWDYAKRIEQCERIQNEHAKVIEAQESTQRLSMQFLNKTSPHNDQFTTYLVTTRRMIFLLQFPTGRKSNVLTVLSRNHRWYQLTTKLHQFWTRISSMSARRSNSWDSLMDGKWTRTVNLCQYWMISFFKLDEQHPSTGIEVNFRHPMTNTNRKIFNEVRKHKKHICVCMDWL